MADTHPPADTADNPAPAAAHSLAEESNKPAEEAVEQAHRSAPADSLEN